MACVTAAGWKGLPTERQAGLPGPRFPWAPHETGWHDGGDNVTFRHLPPEKSHSPKRSIHKGGSRTFLEQEHCLDALSAHEKKLRLEGSPQTPKHSVRLRPAGKQVHTRILAYSEYSGGTSSTQLAGKLVSVCLWAVAGTKPATTELRIQRRNLGWGRTF